MSAAAGAADRPHIVIIGGGISGLSAAWQARDAARVTVLEASARWGGKIVTQTLRAPTGGQFLIDAGPDSFVTRKRAVWTLTQELGLADAVIDPGSAARGTYVLDAGRPQPLPLGPAALLRSPLLTARGKLRLLAEPLQPRRRDGGDESLAEFVRRRLGPQALDKLIGPVLGGIYNSDPAVQSILVTAPIMREMERDHGSLFVAAAARALRARRAADADRPPHTIINFRDGAAMLPCRLVERLAPHADLRLNAPVVALATATGGGYTLTLADGAQVAADGVIVTTPANAAADLLAPALPAAAALLRRIRHTHIGTLSLAYRAADLLPLGGMTGLMIPRRSGRPIDAVVVTSRKQPQRVPDGYGLLRVFFGGGEPATALLDDAALLTLVRAELHALLGIAAAPVDYSVTRWLHSYAEATVGHLDRVAEIEQALPRGVRVAGASYRGLAVPDCIAQGRAAAAALLAALATHEGVE